MGSHKSLVRCCRKQFPTWTPVLSLGSILENANFMKDFCQKNKIMWAEFRSSASLMKLAGWVKYQLPTISRDRILTPFPQMTSEISLQSARQASHYCPSCLPKHTGTVLAAAPGPARPQAPKPWHNWWGSRGDHRSSHLWKWLTSLWAPLAVKLVHKSLTAT